MKDHSQNFPKLAAPGAGLPWLELLMVRFLFRRALRKSSPDSASSLLRGERVKILRLVDSCSPEDAGRRVLIKRPPGLEDSSRYWSLLMTLDHLRIVNSVVAGVIRQLSAGIVPGRTASTADVKPSPEPAPDVREAFEASCAGVLRAAVESPDLNTGVSYAHPWFGSLDARGWHLMAGIHMRLHRGQIESILRGLRNGGQGNAGRFRAL